MHAESSSTELTNYRQSPQRSFRPILAMRRAALHLLCASAAASELSLRLAQLDFDAAERGQNTSVVRVGVTFQRLKSVDDVKQIFEADIYLTYTWEDARNYAPLFRGSRLAHREGGGRRFVEVTTSDMAELWRPPLSVVNQDAAPVVSLELLRLYQQPSGVHELVYARQCFFKLRMLIPTPEYHGFPFDVQQLSVVVQPTALSSSSLRLEQLAEQSGLLPGEQDWVGWEVERHQLLTEVVDRPYAMGNATRVRFSLQVHRAAAMLASRARSCCHMSS